MLNYTPMGLCRFGRFQGHEAAIMGVSLLAQEHHIALYATVSDDGAYVEVEFLPWNARQIRALLDQCRAHERLCCATRRRSWWRGEDSMALQGRSLVQMRR